MKITNTNELFTALKNNEEVLELQNALSVYETITLKKGQKLISENNVLLSFINGDGIALEGENEISNISIQTSPNRRAIYLNSNEVDLGTIKFNNLTVTGVVQLLTRNNNEKLDIEIDGLDIVSADARAFSERAMKYGVTVYQGAITIYNFNPKGLINVKAENISVGRPNAPVLGSGIYISGFGDENGFVEISKLTTGEIHSNGMIPTGQPNLITGGIFILYGAHAKEIISNASVQTYGTNDMVLDVWGTVDKWTVKAPVISYGRSGIGFVNFGSVKDFRAEKEVITYGQGARGFNQYDGTIENAFFQSIETHGDGSIGMQFSKPVGQITIGNKVETFGGTGETLVKGVIMNLRADAINVLQGGEIDKLVVNGDIITNGDDVVSLHVNGGLIQNLEIAGEVLARGKDSRDLVIENSGKIN